MRNARILSRRLSPSVRVVLLVVFSLLVIGNIIGWSSLAGCGKGERETAKLTKENSSLAIKAEELEKTNRILCANIKQTDNWLKKRDELIVALALELPIPTTIDKVTEIALANKGPEDVYIFGKIFEVGKPENRLTSKEVKVREIGEKIQYLSRGGENY